MNPEIFVLGIQLGFNTSVSLVSSTRGIVYNIQNERATGVKNSKVFPIKALLALKKQAERDEVQIDRIHTLSFCCYQKITAEYIKKYWDWHEYPNDLRKPDLDQNQVMRILTDFISNDILRINISQSEFVNHHLAHAYSALPYYINEFKESNSQLGNLNLFVTYDGFGDTVCASIRTFDKDGKQGALLSEIPFTSSVAGIYQFFTGALGFKEHQHEGKLTGLAAHGKPVYLEELLREIADNEYCLGNSKQFKIDTYKLKPAHADDYEVLKGPIREVSGFIDWLRLKRTIYKFVGEKLPLNYSKDRIEEHLKENTVIVDLCATVQTLAEKVVMEWLEPYTKLNHSVNLYCAGGLFANVKLNNRLMKFQNVKNVYVTPPMGDEGTSLGAALKVLCENEGIVWATGPNYGVHRVFTGLDSQTIGDCNFEKIISEIKEYNFSDENPFKLKFDILNDNFLEIRIAKLLAKDRIVHVRYGEGEYGPRALGHATTYYTATDPDGTKTLNKAMKRSEFMPYAPCIKTEYLGEFFIQPEKGHKSAQYMTMTFDILDSCQIKNTYKGAIHVDNTARPQAVADGIKTTQRMYNILTKYEQYTGLKMLINTSFNVHNTPTNCTLEQCWTSWKESGFIGDALVLENMIITKEKK